MDSPVGREREKRDSLGSDEDTDVGRGRDSVLRPPRGGGEASGASDPRPDSFLAVLAGFGIPFLLIFTLAVEAGGYEVVLRSQVGIVVWWVLLLGLAAGLLPATGMTRAAQVATAVFAGFVLLTAVAALTWTESAERSVIELSRNLTILGAFLLLLLIQRREGLRRSLAAVATATALVAVIALVDRFDPGLLPFGSSQLLPENYPRARLNFPLEYWNGLAAMMAIGLAPLLWMAGSSRDTVLRALAAAAIPLVVLATYMTASRGGAAAAVLALVVLIVISPGRLRLALVSVFPILGSAALIVLVNRRPEIRDLVFGATADSQGIEMMWICAITVVLVGGLQYTLSDLLERGRLVVPDVGRRATRATGAVAAGLVVAALLAGLFSGFLSDRWNDFKEPVEQSTVSRLSTVNSSERYLVWESALDAAASERLTGIGPGAFEYWWAREGSGAGFVRDAHSLYFETLAEMGPLAFVLVLLLVFGPIVWSVGLSRRRPDGDGRGALAAAAAGMVAFAVAAGVDWAWELTVLPVMFFALVAAVLGPEISAGHGSLERPGLRFRLVGAAVSLLAVLAITVPMLGTEALESSQQAVRAGDLERALDDADRAVRLQPYAASPRIQQAQVLELLGRHDEAIQPVFDAIDRERENWRNWLVLSQILRKTSPEGADGALERARELNPRSKLPELTGNAGDGG
jgi:hypothetical protein